MQSHHHYGAALCACVLSLLALAPTAMRAQETLNYASIAGRIVDPAEATVAGAKVTARQLETNVTSTTMSDSDGRFRFPYLRVGPYELAVQQEGFQAVTRRLTLTIGAGFDVPVRLGLAASNTAIVVAADQAPLEATRTQIAGTILPAEIHTLPLNGRNFLDLALLIPGVSPTNTASTQLFPETSAAPGQGLSINSQRNFSNSFIVDGLSANDDAAGLIGAFYGLDTVQEFQVVTSGGQAEFGRALGGYISMVTRSGTNTVHGDLYGYLRNQRFNAANPLSHTTLPSTQAQYGASIGGPLRQDRSFYFANVEERALNQSGLITIAPVNVDAINARLTAIGYGGSLLSTGLSPNPVHSTNVLAKADHQLSSRDQFTLRYSLYDVHSSASRGAGALSAVSASAGLDNTDQTAALSNVFTISPHTVNETRAQYTHSSLSALPTDLIGPAVSISGVAAFGTLSGSPTGRENHLYEVADNLAHQVGNHALRAGVDFLYNDLTIQFPRSIRGSYSFSSLANFLAGTYNNSGFTQTFGNSTAAQTNPNAGLYVQDEWRVNPRFTLNLGVRYDLQFLQTVATDTNNVSPRAGFAWTPFATRRTVVRGSYGLFYDRIPLRAVANALLSGGGQMSLSLSPTQSGAPVFPNTLSSVPTGVLVNLTSINPRLQSGYSEQGSFEIEQQLSANSTLSVSYQHVRGLHLLLAINQNVPTCVAAGTNNGCRPNSAYGNNSQYNSLGDSHYDGLLVSFVQRPSKWGSYRLSYAYSKALDNVGEFFFSAPIDNFNIWRDYGRSDDDQRHRFVLDGTLHTPQSQAHSWWQHAAYGFQWSGILQYYSPLPFNITTGANTIQGTAARPAVNGAYISRNAGQGFDSFTINSRLSRRFTITEKWKLEALAEGFNLLNHRNDQIPNGVFGAGLYPVAPVSTFGQPTAVADARTLQLALRLSF